MATAKQVQEFITLIAPLAVDICNRKEKKVLPSVCIAQACCESAYGTSPKMIKANAVFGIKVGKSKVHFGTAWKDKAYSTKTKECYDGKTYTTITDMFRAYDSIRDAVEDYYDMLGSCSRYAGCIGVTDYTAAITAIKNGGYATSPTYISTITSIIKKYNLTQYDACMADGTPAKESKFTIGKNYILQANMYVRDASGGNKKQYIQLTTNAKSHALKQADGSAVLKKGTVVTVKDVTYKDGAVWVKIPSGWVCAVSASGTIYVK